MSVNKSEYNKTKQSFELCQTNQDRIEIFSRHVTLLKKIVPCVSKLIQFLLKAHAHDCELKLGSSYLITGYFTGSSTTYQLEACHLRGI